MRPPFLADPRKERPIPSQLENVVSMPNLSQYVQATYRHPIRVLCLPNSHDEVSDISVERVDIVSVEKIKKRTELLSENCCADCP